MDPSPEMSGSEAMQCSMLWISITMAVSPRRMFVEDLVLRCRLQQSEFGHF